MNRLKRTIKSYVETFPYDANDFILDLLASVVISDVEQYLTEQYDESFRMGLDGWLDIEPDEATRREAIYADVDGKTFADRIMEYAALSLEDFEAKVLVLAETDGHRVRSNGTLDAGSELTGAGLTVVKTWRGVMDQRERDAHVELEGVTIPYDAEFEVNGYRAPAPGLFGIAELDCGCRCTLTLTVAE